MSEELSHLKSVGALKISEETNIPLQSVQAILHHSFEAFSKVQFMGFVSILEREYKIEFPELKSEALAYFDTKREEPHNRDLFVEPKKRTNFTLFYTLLAFFIFISLVIYSFTRSSNIPKDVTQVDNTLIKNVTKKMSINEVNATLDANKTVSEKKVIEVEAPKVEELAQSQIKVLQKSFQIHPLSKVWLGYIDVEANKKYQKIFDTNLTLDANKTWLLTFGHGYIDMFVNGRLQKFASRNKKRFYYKDGELKAISSQKFKQLNRGHKW